MKDLFSHEHNNEAYTLLKQINHYLEQESKFLPRPRGLDAIESTLEVGLLLLGQMGMCGGGEDTFLLPVYLFGSSTGFMLAL